MSKYTNTKPLRLKPNLGTLIKKEREAQELSMLGAADKAGLRESHWSTLESKSANGMNLITADRVCAALGKDLNWLLNKKKKK